MKITKTRAVTIELDEFEIQLLQDYLEWARRYANENKDKPFILNSRYTTFTDVKVDMDKVMNRLFEI